MTGSFISWEVVLRTILKSRRLKLPVALLVRWRAPQWGPPPLFVALVIGQAHAQISSDWPKPSNNPGCSWRSVKNYEREAEHASIQLQCVGTDSGLESHPSSEAWAPCLHIWRTSCLLNTELAHWAGAFCVPDPRNLSPTGRRVVKEV